MMFPTPMIQLVAVVLEPDVERVTSTLLDAGVIDFIDTRKLASAASISLSGVADPATAREITELRSRIDAILSEIEVTAASEVTLDISRLERIDLEASRQRIDRVTETILSQRTAAREAEQELARLSDMRRQLALFGSIDQGLKSASRFSYLTIHSGSVETKRLESLRQALSGTASVAVETGIQTDRTYLVLIGLRRDQKGLDEIMERHGFQDSPLSGDGTVEERVSGDFDAKIDSLEAKRTETVQAIRAEVTSRRSELLDLWERLKLGELYAAVQSSFSKTKRTVLFSGWLPEHDRDDVDARIREACAERCYLEWRKPRREERAEIPVDLDNPKFLAPFELLVRNYSVPAYGTIDPTPLVAISYLAMFGLMFGDAGHGLVIALCGIVGRALYRKRGAARELLTLLIWCGSAGIVSGVLFGSYFGMQWFPPLWFDYNAVVTGHGGGDLVGTIYDVLAITVYFGVSIITLGLILNWINLVLRRDWFDLVFDKAGVLGGIIYLTGVWAAVYFVGHEYRELPNATILVIFIGLPALALTAKAPLEYLEQRRNGMAKPLHPLSIVDFGMEWIVELLEIFSGYLANTLSFMRVAGLGIAHEALMIAFFSIARMVAGGSINALSIVVLIFGNILVILLEGLSAGIQSLRLNYYEFFSKYFTGSGRVYRPVSLRKEF